MFSFLSASVKVIVRCRNEYRYLMQFKGAVCKNNNSGVAGSVVFNSDGKEKSCQQMRSSFKIVANN